MWLFWAYSNQKLNFETVTETPIYLSSFIKMIFDNEIEPMGRTQLIEEKGMNTMLAVH